MTVLFLTSMIPIPVLVSPGSIPIILINMFRKIFLVTCFICLGAAPALAKSYFNFSSGKMYKSLLKAPYAEDSEERKSEIKAIIKLQSKTNPDTLRESLARLPITPESFCNPSETGLTRPHYPKLYRLLDRSEETAQVLKTEIKNFWNVRRPYHVNEKIDLLSVVYDDQSYPSGNATRAYVLAHVLKLVFPEKEKEFYGKAMMISSLRVASGEHFQSDIDASHDLSLIIFGALLQNSEFRDDLKAAQKEISVKK